MIFVVVPAFNEEKQIGRVLRGLFEHGFNNVIVVDDGSIDRTADEAKGAGARAVRHPVNRGQGAALQTGNEYALGQGADFIAHFDADGQFNPADIAPSLEIMREKQLDAVLGSRFLDNRSQIPGLKKHLILPISRLVNFLLTGVWLSDAHNGFRILSRQAAEAIKITQDGMAHNSEIVAQIKKKKLKFAEVPVEVKYFEYGQGIGGGFRIIKDIIWGFFTK